MRYPERYRVAGAHGEDGQFVLGESGNALYVQASTGGGWDHVSVHADGRCPTWEEMEAVREMFFDPTHWVMEFSPPRSKRVNVHPHCLHMWRPQAGKVPTPPEGMV